MFFYSIIQQSTKHPDAGEYSKKTQASFYPCTNAKASSTDPNAFVHINPVASFVSSMGSTEENLLVVTRRDRDMKTPLMAADITEKSSTVVDILGTTTAVISSKENILHSTFDDDDVSTNCIQNIFSHDSPPWRRTSRYGEMILFHCD